MKEAAALDEAALEALLRREGLQMADLTAWRQAAEQALEAKPTQLKSGASVEAKRVQELERELARKERAQMQARIEEAVANGARRAPACAMLGVSIRTLERWRAGAEEDQRHGPRTRPANALAAPERARLLATVNSGPYCDLSPHQIVPRLADAGQYLASESTMCRFLRAEQQLAHRGRTAMPQRRATRSLVVTGPNQVWS